MTVCIVSFSSRKNGNCSQIGEFLKTQFSNAVLFNFANFSIHPCGDCSCECFKSGENCPFFDDKECEILDAITNSSATYFVLPNYCDYPPSNFFVFNERSLCYFQNKEDLLNRYLSVPKKFILVSNSNLENFKTAFTYHTNEEPEILSLSTKKYGKVSVDGNLLTSEEAVDDLKKFITA